MLKYIKQTVVVTAALLLGSCNDYLDIPKKGLVIPETIQDFREMMNNFDLLKNGPCNPYYLNDNIKLYKDDMGFLFNPDPYINGYCWNNFLYNGEELQDRDWNGFYAQIHTCNTVLDGIDAAKGSNEALRREVKGEALAQRAYAYFMLVNEYGPHYKAATAAGDLGVPLYVAGDGIENPKARSSVADTYKMIEEDLLAAEKLVSDAPNENFKPSKAGIRGLLALMYLYQGLWTKAASYADAALETHSFLYDYAALNFMMPAPMQWMGAIGYPTDVRKHQEVVWMKYSIDPMIYIFNVYMSDELKTLYGVGDGSVDRRIYFNQIDAGMFGVGMHGKVIFTLDNVYRCGIHTPHLILIRAEGNVRSGQKSLAIADLNTLRQKRFNADAYTPYVAADYTDAEVLKMVLDERRKELFLECWRWFDLKRLNQEPAFAKTISRVFDGATYTLAPSSPNYVMAIPKNVCNFNHKIIQNQRER